MASKREAWLSLLPVDPRPGLLSSDEPFARFVTMTAVLGTPEDDIEVRATRKAVVADPRVRALVDRLPRWELGFTFSGHNSPGFPPNLLRLLHGMGVRAGDFPAIEHMLDMMLCHQADDGRYLTYGGTTAVWKGKTSSVQDRQSAAEIVEALATTIGPDLLIPRSCYKGFEEYSFGQKRQPSPWATARVCGLLRAFSPIIVDQQQS